MYGKEATVQKMYRASVCCPCCVYFCSILLCISVTCSLEQGLSLYIVCMMPDLQPSALVMPKAEKVAECALLSQTHPSEHLCDQSAQFLSP